MLAYALPVSESKTVLWVPGPQRFAWGELQGLDDALTVLSADPDLDTTKIPLQIHDNLYRPTVRKNLTTPFWQFVRLGWRQLWGLIWLIGITKAQILEDLISGIYLLLGLPLFTGLCSAIQQMHKAEVLEQFNVMFYAPTKIDVVYSPRLKELQEIFRQTSDPIHVLAYLDEYGFAHLREFYRRCCWSQRWEVGPPTGQGMLK